MSEIVALSALFRNNAEGSGQIIHLQVVMREDITTLRRTRTFGVGFDERPEFLARTIGDELLNLVQNVIEELAPPR